MDLQGASSVVASASVKKIKEILELTLVVAGQVVAGQVNIARARVHENLVRYS